MTINTFKNEKGNPIVRKCANCRNWKTLNNPDETGYCVLLRLQFAYSLEVSMYATTKKYNLCDRHALPNEEGLREAREHVSYDAEYLKQKAPNVAVHQPAS